MKLRLVSLLFALLIYNIAAAQREPALQSKASANSLKDVEARKSVVRASNRFLGWKFAQRTGRAAQWPHREAEPVSLDLNGTLRTPQSTGTLASNSAAFVNPGFATRTHLPTGYIPTAVTQADFNGDGRTDVAISNGGDNTVYVLLGNGDGTFQVPFVLYTRGQAPIWITSVSLRNNGHQDLIVCDADSQSLEVFIGNGDGTFQPGAILSLQQVPTFLLAADVNKDGRPDIVVGFVVEPGPSPQPQFEVLFGDGSGGFSGTLFPPPLSVIDPTPTGWIASGDLNKDGYLDFVTTIAGGAAFTYLNQAGTAFLQGDAFGPNDGPMVVELGDMDEDGCLDAVELGTFGYLTLAKGNCTGTFAQATFTAEVGDIDPGLKLADVNGDGHLDVVASAAFYDLSVPGMGAEAGYLVSVLKGDGKGGFTGPQIYRGGWETFSLVVADFTGDNKPEIITVDSGENQASFFRNDGNGNYDGAQGGAIGYLSGVANAPNPTMPLQSADINGDGKPDLLLIEDGAVGSLPSQITVMLNDGSGKFLPPIRSPISIGPTVPYPDIALGLFRNATKPDLVYINKFTAQNLVAFFPGNGDGSFGTPITLATLPSPAKIVTGDFNSDGKLDFAVYGGDGTGLLEIDTFLGQGGAAFRQLPPQIFSPPPGTAGVQQIFALDLNHDGKLDLLIGNNTNSGWTDSGDDLLEFLGKGDGTFKPPTILIPHFGAVAIADVNRDGYADLVQERNPKEDVGVTLFGKPGATVYLGKADGTFLQQPTFDLPGAVVPSFEPLLVGDFNGDGIQDIAVRYLRDNFGLGEPRLRVLQGVGDGSFIVTNDVFQLPGYSDPLVGADFDGDGKTDLMELVGYTSSFHTLPAAAAPSITIALNSNPIVGAEGSATVTLNKPSASTATVTLASSDAAVQIPPSLSFLAGQQSQSFSFTLGSSFNPARVLALYATLGTETAVAYGARPNPNLTVGVAASVGQAKMSITPGETLQLTLALGSQGGYSGTFVQPQCLGLPAGASCSFGGGPLFVSAGGSAVTNLTLATSASTPFGDYPLSIVLTDGFVQAIAPLQLGIGDFTITLNPSVILMGPSGSPSAIVSSTSTHGLDEFIVLSCSGLPANILCGETGNVLNANGGSTSIGLGNGPFTPQDYPFQVVGTAKLASHTVNAVLRVGDFTATIDKTTATLSSGQSAGFNVSLASVNHYSSSITVFCSLPSSSLTCTASPSPATLVDAGTTTVQVTISAPQKATLPNPWNLRSTTRVPQNQVGIVCAVLSILLLLQWRKRPVFAVAAVLLVFAIVACGGGGGSTPPQSSGPPPSPPTPGSQTVTVTVVASAASTQSDFGNQKLLGPITITLQ